MTEVAPAAKRPQIDSSAAIEALRARGAARFDPVRFRFIEALARRAVVHRDAATRVLESRLISALADFSKLLDRAATENIATLARATAQFPDAADALKKYCDAGDFGGLQRMIARLAAQRGESPLAGLLAHIGRHSPDSIDAGAAQSALTAGTPRCELKAMAYFRNTWSKLSVDRQLSRSLAQAPANAGPLNSEFLLLQALTTMRDISPEYLRQFMTYADTLLWLDQAESGRSPARKSAARGEREKKRKTGQGKA